MDHEPASSVGTKGYTAPGQATRDMAGSQAPRKRRLFTYHPGPSARRCRTNYYPLAVLREFGMDSQRACRVLENCRSTRRGPIARQSADLQGIEDASPERHASTRTSVAPG